MACPCCGTGPRGIGTARSRATRCGAAAHGAPRSPGGPARAELPRAPRAPLPASRAQGAVWSCVLNQAALLCATGSADFSARLWDACSGNQLHEFQHNHIVRSTAFSASSEKLATGGACAARGRGRAPPHGGCRAAGTARWCTPVLRASRQPASPLPPLPPAYCRARHGEVCAAV